MKKKNLSLISVACLFLAFFGVWLIVGCSSSGDDFAEMNSEDSQNVQAVRARVMEMAQKYGLTIELSDEFDESVRNGTFNLEETAKQFHMMSALCGYYEEHGTPKQKGFQFNSAKKFLKMRKDLNPARENSYYADVSDWTTADGQRFTVLFNIESQYAKSQDAVSKVVIRNLNGVENSVSYYWADDGPSDKSASIRNLNYVFVGINDASCSFSFNFSVKPNSITYVFSVMGSYDGTYGTASIVLQSKS